MLKPGPSLPSLDMTIGLTGGTMTRLAVLKVKI